MSARLGGTDSPLMIAHKTKQVQQEAMSSVATESNLSASAQSRFGALLSLWFRRLLSSYLATYLIHHKNFHFTTFPHLFPLIQGLKSRKMIDRLGKSSYWEKKTSQDHSDNKESKSPFLRKMKRELVCKFLLHLHVRWILPHDWSMPRIYKKEVSNLSAHGNLFCNEFQKGGKLLRDRSVCLTHCSFENQKVNMSPCIPKKLPLGVCTMSKCVPYPSCCPVPTLSMNSHPSKSWTWPLALELVSSTLLICQHWFTKHNTLE